VTELPISLSVSRVFMATPETVFDAWLDAESAVQWLFATPGGVMERVQINPRLGGGFEVVERRGLQMAAHFGVYLVIDRPHRLVFDFRTDPGATPTRVSVAFEVRDNGCFVTLSHVLDPRWAAYEGRTRAGWSMILDGLARALRVP
jgi:uncharacterized protein YndB with AHSA1/START domain